MDIAKLETDFREKTGKVLDTKDKINKALDALLPDASFNELIGLAKQLGEKSKDKDKDKDKDKGKDTEEGKKQELLEKVEAKLKKLCELPPISFSIGRLEPPPAYSGIWEPVLTGCKGFFLLQRYLRFEVSPTLLTCDLQQSECEEGKQPPRETKLKGEEVTRKQSWRSEVKFSAHLQRTTKPCPPECDHILELSVPPECLGQMTLSYKVAIPPLVERRVNPGHDGFINEGSQMFCNLNSLLRDPKVWRVSLYVVYLKA